MPKYKVLSTKKLSPPLIEQAKQHDIEIIEQEFISVQPVITFEKKEEVSKWLNSSVHNIVFTSANAVEAVKQLLSLNNTFSKALWKVYCLSGNTKKTVSTLFNETAIAATADNATALAQAIIQAAVKEVIFFCGNKRRNELSDLLKEHNIIIHEVVVYETVDTPSAVTHDIDGILFFSPSAVTSFFSSNQLKEGSVCFAIGSTTANAIANYTHTNIITSTAPNQKILLAAVTNYFTNKVSS